MTREHEQMVNDNMGLVGYMIRKTLGGSLRLGCLDYDDLFQVASIGLCKAAVSYKADGRAAFSTYACVVIRNALYDALWKESRIETTHLDESIAVRDVSTHDELPISVFDDLGQMTPAEKRNFEALVLYAEGYSCKQIGEKMGDKQPSCNGAHFQSEEVCKEQDGES